MDLEDVLCPETQIKILKSLLGNVQLNPSQIAEKVGANYETVRRYLAILEAEGILEMRPFGRRICLYRFNMQSPRATTVQALLEAWKH